MAITLLLSVASASAQIKNATTETVKIYGNCGMCKTTIETAGNLKKVAKVEWNKDTKMASLAIGGSITLSLLISGAFSLIFLLAMDPILLTCLGASETVLPYAHSYGMIIVAGIVFSVYTNVMNPIIRSDGSPI